MNNGSLEQKVVVVTGSAGGIGKVIALEMARRKAHVVVNSRSAEKLEGLVEELEEAGGRALSVAADLRDPDQVRELVETTRRQFGRIDVLVNNAGGRFVAPAEKISPNGWRSVVDTNLTSAFLCAQAVFPLMTEQGGGRIINISSVAGLDGYAGEAHYAAAKSGLNNLTATLAVEWARHGIQVNCVAPGAVLTDASSFTDPGFRNEVEAAVPGGRIGHPEEIAELVLFLAGMQGTYLNGETIRIDGAVHSGLPSPHH